LAGGVAVIRVGGRSEIELKERKDRVEDALAATRAALAEGFVPGGGVALVRALSAIEGIEYADEDERLGGLLVARAATAPLAQIAANAGHEPAVVVEKVREGKGSFGFNARTETYEDLEVAGVIDPTKVVRLAFENAVSVAALMLTTEATIH